LRAQYESDVDRALARLAPAGVLSDADLAPLPEPVQRYLRFAGAVGQPRVRNFRVRMTGRIRNGPQARWISLDAEQYNFLDEPARFFYLTGWMSILPVQGYHRYVGPHAIMNVKAAGLVPVVNASGPEMDQAETVTMFNDMCIFAPASLVEPAIAWELVDARTTRAQFTNAGHTIRAALHFGDSGELVDFVSDDRYATSSGGGPPRRLQWSTPVRGYRSFGAVRLSSSGEARWHEPDGDYAYIELAILDVQYNLAVRAPAP
jgi:hypothetical protein